MSRGLVRAMGVTLVILLVAGCEQPPPRALFTVNYYKTHQNDRLAKLKECVSQAQQIIFLGFAYHEQNMQLIKPSSSVCIRVLVDRI